MGLIGELGEVGFGFVVILKQAHQAFETRRADAAAELLEIVIVINSVVGAIGDEAPSPRAFHDAADKVQLLLFACMAAIGAENHERDNTGQKIGADGDIARQVGEVVRNAYEQQNRAEKHQRQNHQ